MRGEYIDLVAQAPCPPRWPSTSAPAPACWRPVLARRRAPRGRHRAGATRPACARTTCSAWACRAASSCWGGPVPRPLARPSWSVIPWLPARPSSAVEQAVYDEGSRMPGRGFLAGLAAHLSPGGEGWLILSDLAEHLGLRSRDELLGWIAAAGLRVLGRQDTPTPGKAPGRRRHAVMPRGPRSRRCGAWPLPNDSYINNSCFAFIGKALEVVLTQTFPRKPPCCWLPWKGCWTSCCADADSVGGVDRCVSEFIRVSGNLLTDRVFLSYIPELKNGGRTLAGVPVRAQLLGSGRAAWPRTPPAWPPWALRA